MKPSDALIIGGGPAGSAAAILLAKAGWGVTLIERKEFPRRKVCGEYLSATNWPLLRSLGIAEAFADLAGQPVRETAIFVGNQIARAPLPRPRDKSGLWGRALSREHLDLLLLEQAVKLGLKQAITNSLFPGSLSARRGGRRVPREVVDRVLV